MKFKQNRETLSDNKEHSKIMQNSHFLYPHLGCCSKMLSYSSPLFIYLVLGPELEKLLEFLNTEAISKFPASILAPEAQSLKDRV